MELGEKIKQARLEAGLSQRQLCGRHITRNMLSQIEHGTARPSMDTLRFLAVGLGKPVSFFLEDQAVTSPNVDIMRSAREAFSDGDYEKVPEIMEGYRKPDLVFDQEANLLLALSHMALAERAVKETRLPYAVRLLERVAAFGSATVYYTAELERRRLLLMAQADPEQGRALPDDQEELLLRAGAALEKDEPDRAGAYLDAAQDREAPQWQLLRGEAYYAKGVYEQAASCFRKAEAAYPRQMAGRLEACYREMGDFKKAYEYACKQR